MDMPKRFEGQIVGDDGFIYMKYSLNMLGILELLMSQKICFGEVRDSRGFVLRSLMILRKKT